MSEALQQAFEATAPQFVAAAWDYADRSDVVETIWIYISCEERVSVHRVMYRAAGQVLDPSKLDRAVPGLDTSGEAQRALVEECSDLVSELTDSEDPSIPVVTIMTFETATAEFSAGFSYDPLHVNPEDEDEPDYIFANRWAQRLRDTGDPFPAE